MKLTNHISQGLHWMIICVGFSLFGFCFVFASGVALSYATDCYQEVSQLYRAQANTPQRR